MYVQEGGPDLNTQKARKKKVALREKVLLNHPWIHP